MLSQFNLIKLTYNVIWLEVLITQLKAIMFKVVLVSTHTGIRNDVTLIVKLGFLISDGIIGTRC
nr:hypothetical protein BCV18_12130 [Vibrio cyclitrophicus]